MEYKIWRQFIYILSFRQDLIDIIKPLMVNLTKNNEQYNINDEKHVPFLKSFSKYHLGILYSCDIISEEKYNTFIPKNGHPTITLNNKEMESYNIYKEKIIEIIKGDKLEELQQIIREKGNSSIIPINHSFNEVKHMKIPIMIECIIHKAINCFKYLLINGIGDPKKTIHDQTPESFYDSNRHRINIRRYKWDCMAIAIYYGEVEIAKILEENGIEKGNNSAHIEAALLSYRNIVAKEIIYQMKERNDKMLNEILNKGLFASAKSNNIKGVEFLIKNGAKIQIDKDEAYYNALQGKTALHYAAENNSKEIGEILISKGADINSKDIIIQHIKILFLINGI